MSTGPLPLPLVSATGLPPPPLHEPDEQQREALLRRASLLAWAGNAWHAVELAAGIAAGVAAGSVALVGFGADSAIEIFSGLMLAWLFARDRVASTSTERRARLLIAASYALLAACLLSTAAGDLLGGLRPAASWPGVALAVVSVFTMPLLARAKRTAGARLGSVAAVSEASENMICAYLAFAMLIGLLANALAGWWWADPMSAIAIALIAAREGRAAWNGQGCRCC